MHSFFFRELQLITVLLLIRNSRIFHFRFRVIFINVYIFGSTKIMNSLAVKRHNSFQN